MPQDSASHDDQAHIGFVILIASVAAMGGFLFGFDSGVINGTVTALQTTFGSSSVGTGFSVASMLIGCAIGAFVAGNIADRIGRKPTMAVTALAFIVSAWGSGIATASGEFVFYRLLGGLAVGAASVLAPAYIAEVSPANWRGRLTSVQQLAIVIGLFAAFISNYALAALAGGAESTWLLGYAAWRWMYWVEVIPAAAYGIGCLLIPESPRYLVRRQNLATAKSVLRRIGSADADQLISDIQTSLGNAAKPQFRDLRGSGLFGLRPIVMVGILLSMFQQLVGINVVFYYGSVLWQAAGFGEGQALLINVISGAVNIASTFVAISLIDRYGRRPLLLAGSLAMTVALAALAIIFAGGTLGADGQLALSSTEGTIALVAANLFVFGFGTSWGPVVWVLLGEMFSNKIRGSALAVAASAQWFTNFLVTMTFPMMLASFGLAGAYGVYATFALLSLLFVVRLVPETRGMSLEAMDQLTTTPTER